MGPQKKAAFGPFWQKNGDPMGNILQFFFVFSVFRHFFVFKPLIPRRFG
jgi:hypothetical protein